MAAGVAKPPGRKQLIESYGAGGFKVAGKRHAGSVLIFREETVSWPVEDATGVALAGLQPLLQRAGRMRILIVGCGRSFSPPPVGLRADLRADGIELEWMDTSAACRTYNVLALEDRDVAAALIAVD